MPIVKREETRFERVKFVKIFKCSAKGEFSCELPPGAAKLLGYTQVTGESLKSVERAYDKAMADYKDIGTTTRKVIIYSFKANCYIFDPTGERCILKLEEVSFAHGQAIHLNCGVFIETKISGSSGDTYSYEPVEESSIPHSAKSYYLRQQNRSKPEEHMMEWTQEREDFFARLVGSLDRIIQELQKLKSPAIALEIADSNTLKLT